MSAQNPNKLKKSEKAGLIATTALLLGGLAASNIASYGSEWDEARDREDTALEAIESQSESVAVRNYTVVLREGVNIREQPHIMMHGANKSDANTDWEVGSEGLRIKRPLVVTIGEGDDELKYYALPKVDSDEEYIDESGKLNPDAFNWIDTRIIGQRSLTTGEEYAYIEDREVDQPNIDGRLVITPTEIGIDLGDGNLLPVSSQSIPAK